MNRKLVKMLTFLKSKADKTLPSSIVLGNNACDLDSVVSSIMYAYFLDVTGNSPFLSYMYNCKGRTFLSLS